MKYTDQQTRSEVLKALSHNPSTLYKNQCINWTGKTLDTNEFYTEVISEELLKNINQLKQISTLPRTNSYSIQNHTLIQLDLQNSNRNEENFAKRIYGLNFDKPGIILDYQIPLKNKRSDKGVGKIDLVSFDERIKRIYLIELKFAGNKETLLRAVLESYSYYKTIDHQSFISCFNAHSFIRNQQAFAKSELVPAVMVVSGKQSCNSYNELKQMKINNTRTKLDCLSKALGVEFFECEIDKIFN